MKKLNDRGVSLVEGLLIAVIVLLIGLIGYYVWHANQTASETLTDSSKSTTPKFGLSSIKSFEDCKKAAGSKLLETFPEQCVTKSGKKFVDTQTSSTASQKTYTNKEYGFSFKYPTTWKLVTDLKDMGRGGNEGTIYVASPSGTKVYFNPDFGGKGGDCVDEQANNEHTTRTCTTRNILDVTKLVNSGSQPIWLVKASDTAPIAYGGGKTTYFVFLLSAGYNTKNNSYDVAPQVGSNLGAYIGTFDDVMIQGPKGDLKVYLTVYVTGNDDGQNSSSKFFDTAEIKEAIPVLESLNIQ
ncbi:MAG TPA: hypothetical protein VHB51_02775 [Candidatus Saccharimonadales bacterium]|nr:hypothetical protein [Candidatus Saccharimonadales bacterium]